LLSQALDAERRYREEKVFDPGARRRGEESWDQTTYRVRSSSETPVGPSHAAEERFNRLFARHERDIYAYCLRRIDRDPAIECAAETFLVAWRRINDVPDGDRAIRWLYRTAHHVIGDHYRRRSRQAALMGALRSQYPVEADGPEAVVVRREADVEVLAALDHLRPADRELLRLAVWEELPHREIGEILGCSAHAVDQRVHRASKRLAREVRSVRHGVPETTTRSSRKEVDDVA
jgi:RNA polymerase sigma-70 factor (ECF subfamily)